MVQAVSLNIVKLMPKYLGVIGYQCDPLDAFTTELTNQMINCQSTINRLSAGHGYRFVKEDFVGDGVARGDRSTDGQYARVKIGAITEVLKYMIRIGKRGLSYPGCALSSHLGKRAGVSVLHPGRHVMAANASQSVAALGDFGRGIVRTARTEVRRAYRLTVHISECVFFFLNPCDARLELLAGKKAL